MYYIYVLRDKKGKIYVGYSSDLKKRIRYHKGGHVKSTKTMIGPKLMYYEAYTNQKAATEREGKLKQHGSSYVGLLKRLKLRS